MFIVYFQKGEWMDEDISIYPFTHLQDAQEKFLEILNNWKEWNWAMDEVAKKFLMSASYKGSKIHYPHFNIDDDNNMTHLGDYWDCTRFWIYPLIEGEKLEL